MSNGYQERLYSQRNLNNNIFVNLQFTCILQIESIYYICVNFQPHLIFNYLTFRPHVYEMNIFKNL